MKKENKALWQQPGWLLILHAWEEYIGTLADIAENDDQRYFAFEDGKALRIPAEYIDDVKEIKNTKIAILATDIPGKELLIKKVGETDE